MVLRKMIVIVWLTALLVMVMQSPVEARRLRTDGNGNTVDPRPHAWCGWWLRHQLGVKDKAYNLARNWRHFGAPAGGPAIGAIVVWLHHVGIITGRGANGWVVKSGNDGHAVRERERSLRGVIAYRWPHGSFAGL